MAQLLNYYAIFVGTIVRFPMKNVTSFPVQLIIISLLLLSCNNDAEVAVDAEPKAQDQFDASLTKGDIDALKYTEYALSRSAENVTKDWLAFQELSRQISFLKEADLSFFKDDTTVLATFISDLKNQLPLALKAPSIEVRISALETALLKLEGTVSTNRPAKSELLAHLLDVFVSHSNLIFQINKKLEKEAQNIQKPQ